jgi:restriction system protein
MIMSEEERIIDATKLSLDEWLHLLFNSKKANFICYEFPTDKQKEEYIEIIRTKTDEEVYRLLSFFPSCQMGGDKLKISSLILQQKAIPEMFQANIETQFYRRLILNASGLPISPWEGTTWILDLLPHFPKQAIEALSAYILAHAQYLPDGRYRGLHDAIQIIRAKFIGLPGTQAEKIKYLIDLRPREFEFFVANLYENMGFHTELTPETRDGGNDIIAFKEIHRNTEKLLIECKRYVDEPIRVNQIRELWSTVVRARANRGVLVTTSRFTPDAQKLAQEDHYVELIDGDTLVRLANEHLGTKWVQRIDCLTRPRVKFNNVQKE